MKDSEKDGERRSDGTLRPRSTEEFIGQKQKIANLVTYITGAKNRNEPLDHVLLYGPPGLGKTTLAHIIALEMGGGIRKTSGPVLERKGDLTAILTDLNPHDVLFIDEIHRMRTTLEEILYRAMEDFQVDVIIGQGVGARNVSLDLNPFTLVGATTRAGLLSSPLRDRFGILMPLGYYTSGEMTRVIRRSAGILGVTVSEDATRSIADRSRGTPRVANKLLRRVRDFAQEKKRNDIDVHITETAFTALGVDEKGFDEIDRRIMRTIIDKFSGGPVGLSTLSTAVMEEKDTIEDVYEPFLIQQGYLKITPRGRMATDRAYRHFGEGEKKPGPLF